MTTKPLVTDIQQILHTARAKSYAALNFAMVEAYWQVGRRIVEEEQQGKGRAEYGAGILSERSRRARKNYRWNWNAKNDPSCANTRANIKLSFHGAPP